MFPKLSYTSAPGGRSLSSQPKPTNIGPVLAFPSTAGWERTGTARKGPIRAPQVGTDYGVCSALPLR